MHFLKLFCCGIIICTGNAAAAQSQQAAYTKDSAQIVAIAQELMDAAGSGDTMVLKKYLTDTYIQMAEDGVLRTKQILLKELHPLPKNYVGSIKVIRPTVKKHDNIYIINFTADEHLALYGQILHTYYTQTDTYKKTGGKWEILGSEVFELPTDPAVQNVSTEKLKLLTGTYELVKGVQYIITLEDGKLFGQRKGREKVQLLPETETVFFIPKERGIKVFVADENGKIIKLMERRSGVDLAWTKVAD